MKKFLLITHHHLTCVTSRDLSIRAEWKAPPAKLADLLLELPNVTSIKLYFKFRDETPVFGVFKASTNETSDTVVGAVKMLPSVRELTVGDERWQFFTNFCPNLCSLTVIWRYSPASLLPSLDFATLGKTNPKLRRLHCPDTCEQNVLEGNFTPSHKSTSC